MKFFVDRLEVGDVVEAQVAEILDASQLIISLHGDLARAHNETNRMLSVGEIIKLRVSATRPLQFRVVANERRLGHLDIVT